MDAIIIQYGCDAEAFHWQLGSVGAGTFNMENEASEILHEWWPCSKCRDRDFKHPWWVEDIPDYLNICPHPSAINEFVDDVVEWFRPEANGHRTGGQWMKNPLCTMRGAQNHCPQGVAGEGAGNHKRQGDWLVQHRLIMPGGDCQDFQQPRKFGWSGLFGVASATLDLVV
ncbi:hypothetical protein OG21DRAFT_1525781 [Imleria badia]|nr:hypothetical protein OG21DRAFT_1525781 [Imleria badia]